MTAAEQAALDAAHKGAGYEVLLGIGRNLLRQRDARVALDAAHKAAVAAYRAKREELDREIDRLTDLLGGRGGQQLSIEDMSPEGSGADVWASGAHDAEQEHIHRFSGGRCRCGAVAPACSHGTPAYEGCVTCAEDSARVERAHEIGRAKALGALP